MNSEHFRVQNLKMNKKTQIPRHGKKIDLGDCKALTQQFLIFIWDETNDLVIDCIFYYIIISSYYHMPLEKYLSR